MNEKIVKWFVFGVLLAIVPLCSVWVSKLIFGGDTSFKALLSQGELLLITAGLCAAGIGEIMGSDNTLKRAKIISGGFSVIILLLSAFIFSLISNPSILNIPPDTEVVMNASIIIYVCAFFSSGSCAYLAG